MRALTLLVLSLYLTGTIPLDKDKVGENVYIDILNHARDFVHIMTPLILDGELLHALKFAAERGVDVSIIMPGIPDKSQFTT